MRRADGSRIAEQARHPVDGIGPDVIEVGPDRSQVGVGVVPVERVRRQLAHAVDAGDIRRFRDAFDGAGVDFLVLDAQHRGETAQGIASPLAGRATHAVELEDPTIEQLALNGGLSPKGAALWGQLEKQCLDELSASDSWGGLPPAGLLGPRGNELLKLTVAKLAADDVRRLPLRDVPFRIEEGLIDEVAPFVFTEQLVQTYKKQGRHVTVGRWPAGHSDTNSDQNSVPTASAWILKQLAPS